MVQAQIGLNLDPMKPLVLGLYGVIESYSNANFEAAIRAYEKSIALDPNFGFSKLNLLDARMEQAYEAREYAKWMELWNDKVTAGGGWNKEGRESVLAAFEQHGFESAIEEMLRMNEIHGNDCFMSSWIRAERYLMVGRYDEAMKSFKADLKIREAYLPYISPKNHYYNQLKDNPDYIEIIKEMKLPE